MKSVEIQGTSRATSETKATIKAVRNSGLVPCVLYGGEKPLHFTTPLASFKLLVFTPDSYLVNLEVDGKKVQAVLQETQFHALTDEMLHADFMQVFEDKAVVMEVPVKLTGTSTGVLAGGKLQVKLKKLKVKALPKNLPDSVNNVEIEFQLLQSNLEHDAKINIEIYGEQFPFLLKGESLNNLTQTINKWSKVHYQYELPYYFKNGDYIKVYVFNASNTPIYIDDLLIRFNE